MTIRVEDIDTLDFSDVADLSQPPLPPIHPGVHLLEDFMKPLEMSANALAQALRVPTNRITAIVNGDRGITADTALRLARYFDMSPEFWLNLQKSYELQVAKIEVAAEIEAEVTPRQVA